MVEIEDAVFAQPRLFDPGPAIERHALVEPVGRRPEFLRGQMIACPCRQEEGEPEIIR